MNPEADPVHTGNTYTGNVINRIALSGGTYSVNRTLTNEGAIFYVLDNLNIAVYGGHSRLTINPGVIVEFAVGKQLTVGGGYPYGGELYAQGTSVSKIIFRAYNATDGGWEGIRFTDYSDSYGSTSVLENCIIRQANAQDILLESTSQPTMNLCTIRNSLGNGIVMTASTPSITNCTFTALPGYPIKFNDWTCDAYLKGNTYTANTLNYLALSGGDYSSNRTFYNDGIPYHVLGDIRVMLYGGHSRITIRPGVTMLFNPGLRLQIGAGYPYGGDLYAEGKADSVISFKPYNNLAGGWAGLIFTDYSNEYGSTSSLKYCSIEKGQSFNINCDNTSQPAIDHCIITQAAGDGVQLTGAANLTITNSSITYNTGNGIDLDNTSTATIGNSATTTCNLFNNSLYEIYNNSTSDVNARYNFWATGDSTMTSLRIYDKSENSAKGRVYFGPFAQVPSLMTTSTVMTGTLKYFGGNVMKNAAMVIKDFSNNTIASATSNTSGVYTFPSFPSGDYKMTITPSNAWGGVNSTDALNIMNHFAQITPLTGMKLASADVNYSHTINGTDALLVMKRYSGLITSFSVGDYLYTSDTVILSGGNVTNNIDMLCFGDANASYAPAKSTSNVGLVHEGSILTDSWSEFELPVTLKSGMQVGAISLGFYYPENYLEITGARLVNGVSGFSWSAANGLFRMGWCDPNALNINDDGVVVILTIKTKDLSGMTSAIALDLYEECEFADASATPNFGAVVSIPYINTTITGLKPGKNLSGLSVYPNPASDHTVVTFSLNSSENIRLSLVNMVGKHVMDISCGDLTPGMHRLNLPVNGLKPGIYLLRITNSDNGNDISDMIKVVVAY